MAELHELTALQLWTELHHGRVSPTEAATHYLDRIASLDPGLGAFVTVTADRALERARRLELDDDRSLPLWGLPLADKDLWSRAEVPTGYGSRLMQGFVPEESDDVVEAVDAAGAVSLGKTNAPEFGLPSYTESLVAPPARNPWNRELGAGGSSGGAATAVSARLLPFAPGSDGGGSVRIPAAACGLVGLKPSRGLVPAGSGIGTLGGLVVVGPLARTVADAALLLDGLIGRTPDGRIDHRFTLRAPGGEAPYLASAVRGEGRYQLAVTTSTPWAHDYEIRLEPEARAALDLAVGELGAIGHGVESIEFDTPPGYAGAFRTLWQVSAAGIPAEGEQLELVEPLTRWLIGQGRRVPATQLAAALGELAAFERSMIAQFAPYDAVLTPALAMTPRPLGWYDASDGEHNFAQQVQYTPYTSMVNVSGLPAIVLPVHETADGLPMGVQLIGRPGGESTLLAIGAQLERRLHWERRAPALV
jgi:amidase